MSVNEILSESESKMGKAVEVLHDELKSVRSGMASTGLVENIRADFYGTPTPLKTDGNACGTTGRYDCN